MSASRFACTLVESHTFGPICVRESRLEDASDTMSNFGYWGRLKSGVPSSFLNGSFSEGQTRNPNRILLPHCEIAETVLLAESELHPFSTPLKEPFRLR